jgi:hypothetical protein
MLALMPPPPAAGQSGPGQLKIIGLSLGLGCTLFLLIALFLPLDRSEPGESSAQDGLISILSMVHLGVFLMAGSALWFAVGPMLERARTSGVPRLIAQAQILRWAGLEGLALFGIVVVLVARLNGVLPGQGIYYANLASYALFIAVLILDLTRSEDNQRSR